jgi:hypothetical protein
MITLSFPGVTYDLPPMKNQMTWGFQPATAGRGKDRDSVEGGIRRG